MKNLILGALLAAGLMWGVPKLISQYRSREIVAVQVAPTVELASNPPVKVEPRPPGGPGDRWLPRVRQLEEQLKQFKNKKAQH